MCHVARIQEMINEHFETKNRENFGLSRKEIRTAWKLLHSFSQQPFLSIILPFSLIFSVTPIFLFVSFSRSFVGFLSLAYLPLKIKKKLMRSPVCLSVCLRLPNKFLTSWQIFIKVSKKVMPLNVNSTPSFPIQLHGPF